MSMEKLSIWCKERLRNQVNVVIQVDKAKTKIKVKIRIKDWVGILIDLIFDMLGRKYVYLEWIGMQCTWELCHFQQILGRKVCIYFFLFIFFAAIIIKSYYSLVFNFFLPGVSRPRLCSTQSMNRLALAQEMVAETNRVLNLLDNPDRPAQFPADFYLPSRRQQPQDPEQEQEQGHEQGQNQDQEQLQNE